VIVFIGQEYDAASALSYLNARYYDGSKANFISQDPTFLASVGLGSTRPFCEFPSVTQQPAAIETTKQHDSLPLNIVCKRTVKSSSGSHILPDRPTLAIPIPCVTQRG
jgi:hypothetical protein